jgi:hypothetical protein
MAAGLSLTPATACRAPIFSKRCHNAPVRVALLLAIAIVFSTATSAVAAPNLRQFTLYVGHTRVFSNARAGDRVVCRGRRYSLAITVPSLRTSVFKQRKVSPTRRLALTVARNNHGGVSAFCRWR